MSNKDMFKVVGTEKINALQRRESLKRARSIKESYMTDKSVYARVSTKGMPVPKGKVYRD